MAEKEKLLPKNMRQMGEKEDRIKIYVEDYVCSYFQKLELSAESWRVGVLFGRHQIREKIPCLFISGALETRAADFENGRLRFTENTWKDIFRRKEEFFPDMGVCGWFVYEKSGGLVDKLSLKKTYEEAFAQGDKVLLLHDDDDQEAFYMLWKGGLDRMKGYYIYYERNDPMQAYMASERQMEPPREEGREAVVQQFRARMEEMRKSGGNDKRDRKDKRHFLASRGDEAGKPGPRLMNGKGISGWLSSEKSEAQASETADRKKGNEEDGTEQKDKPFLSDSGWKQVRLAAACVAILLVGTTLFHYREKLKGLETSVNNLISLENSTAEAAATMPETGESLVAGLVTTADPSAGMTTAPNSEVMVPVPTSETAATEPTTPVQTEGESIGEAVEQTEPESQQTEPETEPETEEAEPETEPTKEEPETKAVSADSIYLVKEGETLSGICWKLYGTLKPMKRFCEINHIENPDEILSGQKLILPE